MPGQRRGDKWVCVHCRGFAAFPSQVQKSGRQKRFPISDHPTLRQDELRALRPCRPVVAVAGIPQERRGAPMRGVRKHGKALDRRERRDPQPANCPITKRGLTAPPCSATIAPWLVGLMTNSPSHALLRVDAGSREPNSHRRRNCETASRDDELFNTRRMKWQTAITW